MRTRHFAEMTGAIGALTALLIVTQMFARSPAAAHNLAVTVTLVFPFGIFVLAPLHRWRKRRSKPATLRSLRTQRSLRPWRDNAMIAIFFVNSTLAEHLTWQLPEIFGFKLSALALLPVGIAGYLLGIGLIAALALAFRSPKQIS